MTTPAPPSGVSGAAKDLLGPTSEPGGSHGYARAMFIETDASGRVVSVEVQPPIEVYQWDSVHAERS